MFLDVSKTFVRFTGLRILAALVVLIGVGLRDGAAAQAAERVTVQLLSGRSFTGCVDERTDATTLWLRSDHPTMRFLRPIAWTRVTTVDLGDRFATSAEFKRDIERWKSAAEPWANATINVNTANVNTARVDNTPVMRTAAELPLPAATPARITTMQIEASPGNWDADVETDGLIVIVSPIDEFGQLTPISGTVEIELIGEGPGTTAAMRTLPTLARWVRTLTPAGCGPSGYVLRLEYQALHPEFNLQLGVFGLAHARLSVAGSNLIEASTNVTGMRPFSPLRDRQQQSDTQRFFPHETTGRGKAFQGLNNGL